MCPFFQDDGAHFYHHVPLVFAEINLKQQLVDQLEKTQKNLHSIKQQYEEKMQVLQQQIKSIEVERDKMLKEIGMLVPCKSKCTVHVFSHSTCISVHLVIR